MDALDPSKAKLFSSFISRVDWDIEKCARLRSHLATRAAQLRKFLEGMKGIVQLDKTRSEVETLAPLGSGVYAPCSIDISEPILYKLGPEFCVEVSPLEAIGLAIRETEAIERELQTLEAQSARSESVGIVFREQLEALQGLERGGNKWAQK